LANKRRRRPVKRGLEIGFRLYVEFTLELHEELAVAAWSSVSKDEGLTLGDGDGDVILF